MAFEWDQTKAATNIKKHGVDFADAAVALEDDLALTVKDPTVMGEERFVTVGRAPDGRLLVVVFTWRGEHIRIISAREATGWERRRYEET